MNPRLLLLLLIVPPPTTASPVTYILSKTGVNPTEIISSAIVVTENVIITTKHPISNYPLNELCAIATPNLTELKPQQIKNLCTPLGSIHFAPSGLALVELAGELPFLPGVNTAEIPLVDSIKEPFDLTTECRFVVNSPEGGNLPGTVRATISYAQDKPTIEVTLKEERELCAQDSGLPLYCKDAVVGIFAYKGDTSKICCVTECAKETGVKAINLVSKEASALLRKFIPVPFRF